MGLHVYCFKIKWKNQEKLKGKKLLRFQLRKVFFSLQNFTMHFVALFYRTTFASRENKVGFLCIQTNAEDLLWM